ncbi:MAG TPA: recombinase family protein [Symbiobacteriaceae bacterium]|nr:recombinase family protein [Symbiobacteriaceae bacterium]
MSSNLLHVHRPAIYASVFLEEGTSLEEQVDRCLKQAAVYGWVVAPDEIYMDAGDPGFTLDRPGMTRLREAVAAQAVDCILVDRLDRLSRNIRETVDLVSLEWQQVQIRSVTEGFSTASPVGSQIISILATFAHSERDQIQQRLEDGRRRRFSEGSRAVGDPPFGYLRGEDNGSMVIEPRQAKVVRRIFRLYLQGHGFMKIAGLLNAEGHGTASGRQWTDKTVRDVTINEVYIGRVKYGGECRPGQHEPIIDQATFAAAQEVRMTRGRIGGRSVGSQFLLSGLVRCKGCGHLFYTQPASESKRTRKDGQFYTTQNQAYYQCGGRLKKGTAYCRCGHIQQGLLEAHVVQRLRARFGPQVASELDGPVAGQMAEWELLPLDVRKRLLQYLIDRIFVWRTSQGKGRFKEAPEIEVDIVWNRREKALPAGDLPWPPG